MDDSLLDCSFFNDKGNLIITESTDLSEFLKEWANHWAGAKQDCFKLTQDIEKFYRDQCDSIKTVLTKVSTIQEALSSATVESFYNIMVNEVKNNNQKEMDELKKKVQKLETEKKKMSESTSQVIEQLTVLNAEKDVQLQMMSTDMSALNQSMDMANLDMMDGAGKKKKAKESKKEKKMKEQIDEMEKKIIKLQKEVRDQKSEVNYYKRKEAKWAESEQDFIKRIYILEEFMIRSHSVINRRAARHMKTLRKNMNLDLKIFDTLMQKQEWSMKLEENKKQLTNSIKELEEFSKSLGGLNNMELEHLKSKINEDTMDKKEDKDVEEEEEPELIQRSHSFYSPDIQTPSRSTINEKLNSTLDLNDDTGSHTTGGKRRGDSSPTASENPEFEDYLRRLE